MPTFVAQINEKSQLSNISKFKHFSPRIKAEEKLTLTLKSIPKSTKTFFTQRCYMSMDDGAQQIYS